MAVPSVISGSLSKSSGTTSANSTTISYTVPSGSNRLLVVTVAFTTTDGKSVDSATYGGTSMRLLSSAQTTNRRVVNLVLTAPPVGTANIVINWTPTPASKPYVVAAVVFQNALSARPQTDRLAAGGSGTSTSPTTGSFGTNPEQDCLKYAYVLLENDTTTITAGSTELWDNDSSNSIGAPYCAVQTATAAESASALSWTLGTSATWAAGAFVIQPVVSVAGIGTNLSTDSSNATSYAITNIGAPVGAWVLVFITKSGSANDGTLTGGGLTWTARTSLIPHSTGGSILFAAHAASGLSNATLTYDCTGDAATGAASATVIAQCGNFTGTFSTDIKQVVTNSGSTANPTLTLSALNSADSAVVFFSANTTSPYGGTPEAEYTEVIDNGYSTPAWGFYLMYHGGASSDVTPVVTRASDNWSAIAVEIANPTTITTTPTGRSDEADAARQPNLLVRLLSTGTNTALALAAKKVASAGMATGTNIALALSISSQAHVNTGAATETDTRPAAAALKKIATTGLASATNTAFAEAAKKVATAGVATSANAALALTEKKIAATGAAASTNTALALTLKKFAATGLATTTDTAFALEIAGVMQEMQTGLAAEADSVLARAAVRLKATGTAASTNAALAEAVTKRAPVSAGTTTNTALARTLTKFVVTGAASSPNTALARAVIKTRAVGAALETDAAVARAATKTRAVALAADVSTAVARAVVRVAPVRASTTTNAATSLAALKKMPAAFVAQPSAALKLTLAHVRQAGLALSTNTAFAATSILKVVGGLRRASELDQASALSGGFGIAVLVSEETDAAVARTLRKIAPTGAAASANTAFATAVRRVRAVTAPVGTNAALSVAVRRTVAAGVAVSTNTALAVTLRAALGVRAAVETSVAFAAGVARKIAAYGAGTEADAALTLTIGEGVTIDVGAADESSSAFGSAVVKISVVRAGVERDRAITIGSNAPAPDVPVYTVALPIAASPYAVRIPARAELTSAEPAVVRIPSTTRANRVAIPKSGIK